MWRKVAAAVKIVVQWGEEVVGVRSKPRLSRDVQDAPGEVVFIDGSTTGTPRTNNKSSLPRLLQMSVHKF